MIEACLPNYSEAARLNYCGSSLMFILRKKVELELSN